MLYTEELTHLDRLIEMSDSAIEHLEGEYKEFKKESEQLENEILNDMLSGKKINIEEIEEKSMRMLAKGMAISHLLEVVKSTRREHIARRTFLNMISCN